jgi:lipopolysaccharide export system protein LptA
MPMKRMLRTLVATLPILAAVSMPTTAALAQAATEGAFSGMGSESRDPIRIDADRLDVFDRENRAVYAGNVVAVQGDTTLRCSELTIFFERGAGGAGETTEAAASDEGDSINRIECAGPVTILSQDQVATGDRAVYDRQGGQMVMTGNVALSQGQNVTRGERLIYDIDRGVANIEAGASQRVRGLFVPGGTQQ